MNIKIFKSANKMSIMDVFPELNYSKENKYGDSVYKGSIRFLINEYGGSKNIKSAYVPKSEAKYICREVLNSSLERYEHYGGSEKGGVVIARVFSISKIRKDNDVKFVFEISEGPGFKNKSGGYALTKNSAGIIKVQKFLSELEMKVMAGEILDFINQSEIIGLQNNKPLYTMTKDVGSVNQTNNLNQSTYINNESEKNVYNNSAIVSLNGSLIDLESFNIEQLIQLILHLKPDSTESENVLNVAKFVLSKKQHI